MKFLSSIIFVYQMELSHDFLLTFLDRRDDEVVGNIIWRPRLSKKVQISVRNYFCLSNGIVVWLFVDCPRPRHQKTTADWINKVQISVINYFQLSNGIIVCSKKRYIMKRGNLWTCPPPNLTVWNKCCRNTVETRTLRCWQVPCTFSWVLTGF